MESRRTRLRDVELHYLEAGEGEPIILIHGWPETSYLWRHVMPVLAKRYRVIAPDIRSLGDSSMATGGMDKCTIGGDFLELLRDQLGLQRWHIVGHDWGGVVAFCLAVAAPEAARTLTIIDVTLPGVGPDIAQGGRRWHHAFHRTPDLPEILVRGREREYLTWFYRNFAYRQDAFSDDDIDEYVRTYSKPGALEAGFGLYRAFEDDATANRALVESGLRLSMPVLAVGGGRAEARGRGLEPYDSMRLVADDVRSAVVADSGHFVPEEQPEALLELLLPFLSDAG